MGLGTTGYSTGNLHATIDENLYAIEKKWDRETAAQVAKSRSAMIDLVERTVSEYGIECGFFRRPHYIYPTDASQADQMREEHNALRSAGLDAEIVRDVPLPFAVGEAVRIDGQAQFHPLAYVNALAKAIRSESCMIFEYSPVIEIDDKKPVVITANGTIRAENIFMATHTPKGFNILQTELGPYREYGIAARLRDDRYPDGLFWSLEEPSHSIRSYDAAGTKYLIVIGEEHKVGQQDRSVDYFQNIEEFARSRFDVDAIAYRWSAQNYRPADGLPYIGKSIGSDHVYVATGYGTNGLLYGALAASIITDMILGKRNLWEDVFSSRRFAPVKSAKDFMIENVNVAREYVRDHILKKDFRKLEDVKPGSGELVEVSGTELAVSRNEAGLMSALHPLCTHLECIVHWNRMEGTWDCPCHGSRFRTDGEVIEGPAMLPLARKDIPVLK